MEPIVADVPTDGGHGSQARTQRHNFARVEHMSGGFGLGFERPPDSPKQANREAPFDLYIVVTTTEDSFHQRGSICMISSIRFSFKDLFSCID